MGFSLTSPAPEKSDPTAKNRVWGFFGETPQSHRENRPQPKQPRQGDPSSLTKTVSGRTYWPSRDPIGEMGGVNLYGMVWNNPIGLIDHLGLEIVAPNPADLKFPEGKDCVTLSLREYLLLQQKWGRAAGGDGLIDEEFTRFGFGCIGNCRASQGGSEKGLPEDYPKTQCWAGREGGKAKAEAAAKKCPEGSTPLVWAKQGAWKDPKNPPRDGDSVDPDSVTHVGGIPGNFNYVTKLGNFYVDMGQHAWIDPNGRKVASNLDLDKGKVFICKKPAKNGRPAEIWCMSCCPKNDESGYNGGYPEKK